MMLIDIEEANDQIPHKIHILVEPKDTQHPLSQSYLSYLELLLWEASSFQEL